MGMVETRVSGLLYIAIFGLGSIAGMGVLSVGIAAPLRITAVSMKRLHSALHMLLGTTTILIGLFQLYKIGVAGQLFVVLAR